MLNRFCRQKSPTPTESFATESKIFGHIARRDFLVHVAYAIAAASCGFVPCKSMSDAACCMNGNGQHPFDAKSVWPDQVN